MFEVRVQGQRQRVAESVNSKGRNVAQPRTPPYS